MSVVTLSFGLNHAIPGDVQAAWGCRAIVNQSGLVDVLGDRQDLQGSAKGKEHLKAWLNGGKIAARPYMAWQKAASRLLKAYAIATDEAEQHVLYEDADGIIVGDTNGSCGYLYVAAWLKPGAERSPDLQPWADPQS